MLEDRSGPRDEPKSAASAATMANPLRGRLMVGRLTLDQVVKVRVLAPQPHETPPPAGFLSLVSTFSFATQRRRLTSTMHRLPRSLAPMLVIVSVAVGAGCSQGKRQFDTPRAKVSGDQAVALLQREVERRTPGRTFSKMQKVATQTPSGTYAWLVRLTSEDGSGDLCGYVWRGEEAGRADGTVIRVRFDPGCRHWID
jgi:hypothetical protein